MSYASPQNDPDESARLRRALRAAEELFKRVGFRGVTMEMVAREADMAKATLYSYVINHRPRADMGTEPHSIVVVTLEEGPRMMTNIVGCPQTPEALQLDMPLEVVFETFGETALPFFQPIGG